MPSNRVLQKFAALLCATGVREAFQAVFLVCLARRQTTTYGELVLALSLGYLIQFVTDFGLNQHLTTLVGRRANDAAARLLQITALKAGLLLCGCAGLAVFALSQGYGATLRTLVLVVGAGLGLEALASSFFVVCQLEGRQSTEGRIRAVAAALGYSYGLAALFGGAGPIAIAAYKAIESGINLAGAVLAVLRRTRLTPVPEGLRALWLAWRGSLVYTLIALAATLYNKANIFVLQRTDGAEVVGQYGVTWQLVDGISCLVSALLLRSVLFPLFVKLEAADRGGLRSLAQNAGRWLLLGSTVLAFVLGVEGDRIIGLVYGGVYREAGRIQAYLAIMLPFACLHNLATYVLISLNRQRPLAWLYGAGLAANLVLCFTLIPTWGLLGAAWAIVLTKAFLAVLTVGSCQRRVALVAGRPFRQFIAAAATGAVLYGLGQRLCCREAAEALALLPLALLAWLWVRKERLRGAGC